MPTPEEIAKAKAILEKKKKALQQQKTTPTTTAGSPYGSPSINYPAIQNQGFDWEYVNINPYDAAGKPDITSTLGLDMVQPQVGTDNLYGDSKLIDYTKTKKVWKDYFDKAGWDPADAKQRTPERVVEFRQHVNNYYKSQGLPAYFDDTENFELINSPTGGKGLWGPATANAPKPNKKAVKEAGKVVDDKGTTITPGVNEIPMQRDANNEWWLQDKNNLGFAMGNLFDIKRYMPWQAEPDNRSMSPTFYDPSRALAANSELVNQGVQGAMNYSNPQAYAANFSGINAKAAPQAADIIGNYNDRNVGIANSFEQYNTNNYNQYAQQKAGRETNLYDKYTVINQQYDNSRRQAKEQIVGAMNNGYTNAAKTQNLNSIYPNFNIDPNSGGNLEWLGASKITPSSPHDEWDNIMERFKRAKAIDPTITLKDIMGGSNKKDQVDYNNPASWLDTFGY